VGGEEDRRTTPAAHEALAREIPASELVFIPESGHFTTLEQPAMVTDVLLRWMTL
jgi:pimeloyl-ACP methyl ester carboxylesterase